MDTNRDNRIYQIYLKIFHRVKSDDSNIIIDKQKRAATLYGMISVIVTLVVNLVGLGNQTVPFIFLSNLTLLIAVIAISVILLWGKMRITLYLILLTAAVALEAGAEMFYYAFNFSVYSIVMILVNIMLMAVLVLAMVMAYIPRLPVFISIYSISIYAACCIISQSSILSGTFVIIAFMFIVCAILGTSLTRSISNIQNESNRIRQVQKTLMESLGMNDEQLNSYLELSRNDKFNFSGNSMLLEAIGEKAKQKIKDNVAYIIEQEQIEYEHLSEILPQMTKSELEICQLILQDRKLSEMAEILNKTASNITCQRTNIRAKLGLHKNDNLRDALLKIVRK